MADPLTPDQVPAVIARLAQLQRHFELVARTGSKHERPIAVIDAKACEVAQQALREWVSREDRERALVVERCSPHTMAHREARRLLKLEDPANAE